MLCTVAHSGCVGWPEDCHSATGSQLSPCIRFSSDMLHVPTDFTSNRNPAFRQVEVERQEHFYIQNRKYTCVQGVGEENTLKTSVDRLWKRNLLE